jgi:hypothetical protein
MLNVQLFILGDFIYVMDVPHARMNYNADTCLCVLVSYKPYVLSSDPSWCIVNRTSKNGIVLSSFCTSKVNLIEGCKPLMWSRNFCKWSSPSDQLLNVSSTYLNQKPGFNVAVYDKAVWNSLKLGFEQFNVIFYWFITPSLQYLVLEFVDTWPWIVLKSPWIWLFLTFTNHWSNSRPVVRTLLWNTLFKIPHD